MLFLDYEPSSICKLIPAMKARSSSAIVSSIFIAIYACVGNPVSAATPQKPAKPPLDAFSSKHDGTLTEDDLYLLFFYELHPDIAKESPPDKLSKENREITIKYARSRHNVFLRVEDAKEKHTAPGAFRFAEIEKLPHFKNPLAPPKPELFGILVRGAYEQIDLGTPPMPTDKAKPATLSYARDRIKGADVWTAQGALMRPITLFEEKNPPNTSYLSEIIFVPSVTFDKLNGSGIAKTKQTDSLVFRLGSDAQFANTNLILFHGLQDIRLNFSHATDFEFRSQVVGGEAEWEPTDLDKALGEYKSLIVQDSPLQYRLRFYGHVEAGSVLDPGEKPALAQARDYARGGFFAQVEIRPARFHRLTLTANYLDYFSMVSSGDAHLFTAGLTLNLDESGNISLQTKYRNGRLPLTLDKVNDITIGLGLKL
jgi:hypothetical protein